MPGAVRLAAELAAAVLQYCALPEQVAATRLEVAQTVAARSCAYLRCANLEACSGGPAAGEGAGSKKCSACRAVYYCRETCSHADWRGVLGAGSGTHAGSCLEGITGVECPMKGSLKVIMLVSGFLTKQINMLV